MDIKCLCCVTTIVQNEINTLSIAIVTHIRLFSTLVSSMENLDVHFVNRFNKDFNEFLISSIHSA